MARRKAVEPEEQFSLFSTAVEKPVEMDADIRGRILQRRRQVLIHSCIYYRFSENVVSDAKWTEWAVELEQLQAKYPEIAANTPWAAAFQGFDHSTGFDLPIHDPRVVAEARGILEEAKRRGDIP